MISQELLSLLELKSEYGAIMDYRQGMYHCERLNVSASKLICNKSRINCHFQSIKDGPLLSKSIIVIV